MVKQPGNCNTHIILKKIFGLIKMGMNAVIPLIYHPQHMFWMILMFPIGKRYLKKILKLKFMMVMNMIELNILAFIIGCLCGILFEFAIVLIVSWINERR